VKLTWQGVDDNMTNLINDSQKTTLSLIKNMKSVLHTFPVYGSRYIKEVGEYIPVFIFQKSNESLEKLVNASPDTFVQLALQITWYRMYKHLSQTLPAIYESASTRRFNHGRTETCRSLTSETLAFVQSFDDDDVLVRLFFF
jgi:hypothetical protein